MPDREPSSGIPERTPAHREDATSQIPAIDLLMQLGWRYLTPVEVDRARDRRYSDVLLRNILRNQLQQLNRYEVRGQSRPFGPGAIEDAISDLMGVADDGLVVTNERIWDRLRLGKSVVQTVDGGQRSFTIRYIDWEEPANNVYHVAEEFAVEREGSTETRRPDIVCFVNGIPFVVIECKASSLPGQAPVEVAISQHLRNQGRGEVPRLFEYAQLLIALAVNDARYGTTGTPLRYWHTWRERDLSETDLVALRGPRKPEDVEGLRGDLMHSPLRIKHAREVDSYLASLGEGRDVTAQDRLLNALCRPGRLLELARHFTVFEGGARKVARYQQYFCVKRAMAQVRRIGPDGRRAGGVVWHTQGSGKSLTMVMLAEAILREFGARDPRIVLVTDRVDLDDQLYDTFRGSGVELVQAGSGDDLRRHLRDPRARIVTTLVHKFLRALKTDDPLADDPDVFVLVDEGHRTQTGTLAAAMRRALPRGCYIGFTGTPILKGEKDTVARFGGLIDTYTIDEAVEDRAVVPLIYEGRHVPQNIDERPIDDWFERYTAALTPEQKADLKRKYSTADQLNRTEQKIRAEAWDISVHFATNFQGTTPFKGQVVAPSKADALLYKRFLDEFDMVSSEVLISPPDTREGHSDIDEVDDTANRPSVLEFWDRMLRRFGSAENYRRDVINRFKNTDETEIIIVVDMLLTGFDAPRNAVLYLTRSLREHTLLQAIARVNRVHEGKDEGLIIDYYGVLGELGTALDLYTAFDGKYDPDDLKGILTDISKAVEALPQRHSDLWAVFRGVANKDDPEAMEAHLRDETARRQFYEALSVFARALKIAFASTTFHADTPIETVERYRQDLRYFVKLRASAARRYAEAVDFRQYEGPIQKLLDTYVGAGDIETIVEPVSIFDRDGFRKEVDRFQTPEAKAEVIANRIRHTIHERMEEDPVFYRRLGEMLREVYERYAQERLQQLDLLRDVEEILRRAQDRDRAVDAPAVLSGRQLARTYYEVLEDELGKAGVSLAEDAAAELAVRIDGIIDRLRIVQWESNTDIHNQMRIAIDDELFDFQDRHSIQLELDAIDRVTDTCIDVARLRARST